MVNSKDTQFEAMASYFRSMLSPVSPKEIEENLSDKLAVSSSSNPAEQDQKALEEGIANKSDEPIVATTEQQDEEVIVAASKDQVEEIKVEEPIEGSKVDAPIVEVKTEEPIEESKADAPILEANTKEPIEESKAETPIVEAKENEPITLETPDQDEKDQDQLAIAELEAKIDEIPDEPETSEDTDDLVAKIDEIPNESESHEEFDVPKHVDFTPTLQRENETEVVADQRPLLDQKDSLSRLIGQVKPETKTETEVVTITAPRNTNLATVRAEEETAVDEKTDLKVETPTLVQPNVQIIEPKVIEETWKNIETPEEFQALFFVMDKVTFAVPLVDLGSINNIDKITSIFGKPGWFMGMMNVREEQIQIVDFAKWAMPQINVDPAKFQYVIELGTSKWGITCTDLIGTENLRRNQIQWRTNSGKRPWLAGIVKDKMCALIHVTELVKLFKKGVNIDGN